MEKYVYIVTDKQGDIIIVLSDPKEAVNSAIEWLLPSTVCEDQELILDHLLKSGGYAVRDERNSYNFVVIEQYEVL